MPKPTKLEIDAEIIDRAAWLFSKYGFANTSLQQIADSVNYSKAGLLHHYPSKQAIYDKVLSTGIEQMHALVETVSGIPKGWQRDLAVVEATVQLTLDWPGIAAFGNRLADIEKNIDPALTKMGLLMYEALGIDVSTVDLDRLIRVTVAFSGLGATTILSGRLDLKREWRSYIIKAAMNALGH